MLIELFSLTRLYFLLLFLALCVASCEKDNDLFTEAITESIEKENQELEDDESAEESQEKDNSYSEEDDSSSDNSSINEDDKATELKAFPTAYGAGAFTTGGRGGQVIHVTNLNDSGEGSLRAALATTGPRIIVFDVSGVIALSSRIYMEGDNYGNVTLAGQTAPRGGVTITGGRIWWSNSENIVIRYLKFRNGNQSDNGDCITIERSSSVVVDHCSFSYARDEALDVSGDASPPNENITLQNNLFGECKTAMIVGSNNNAGYGGVSVLRNATANVGWRFPKAGGAVELDVINNVHHNWRARTIRMDAWDYTLNQINNYYQSGSSTFGGLHKTWTNTSMSPRIYSSGNFVSESAKPTGYDENPSVAWEEFSSSSVAPKSEWFVDSELPIQGAPVPLMTALEARNYVLENAGAHLYINDNIGVSAYRDSLDEHYLNLIQTNSKQEVLKEAVYGELPTGLPSEVRPDNFDTDGDGMPNRWEAIKGLNPNVDDGKGDEDGDGYTNIEEYLNLVDF